MENDDLLIRYEWRLVDDKCKGSLSNCKLYITKEEALTEAMRMRSELVLKGYHFNKIIINKSIYENISDKVTNVYNYKDLEDKLINKVIC